MIRLDPEELHHLFDANFDLGLLYHKDGRIVHTWNNGSGYQAFRLYPWPSKIVVTLHRVLWVMFHRIDIPDEMVIDHIDHDRGWNAITNLQLMTKWENNQKKLPYKKSNLNTC